MKPLTKAEEQMMLVIWKLGKGFLKDIALACPEPKPHPNTIATVLKTLINKNFVEVEVKGRNHLYRPKSTKSEYGRRLANQLVKGYFDGSPAKLLLQFMHDNRLSLQDVVVLLQRPRR